MKLQVTYEPQFLDDLHTELSPGYRAAFCFGMREPQLRPLCHPALSFFKKTGPSRYRFCARVLQNIRGHIPSTSGEATLRPYYCTVLGLKSFRFSVRSAQPMNLPLGFYVSGEGVLALDDHFWKTLQIRLEGLLPIYYPFEVARMMKFDCFTGEYVKDLKRLMPEVFEDGYVVIDFVNAHLPEAAIPRLED